MVHRADEIAASVVKQFQQLPPKTKPRKYDSRTNRVEWTPLSGIVLSKGNQGLLKCVSLGTGMRCLPSNKIPLSNGFCLHDWHAETVAIRAFNLFLLQECISMLKEGGRPSEFVQQTNPIAGHLQAPPFKICDDVRIHMYCSVAPCGDASMELTMSQQENSTPWTRDFPRDSGLLHGRGYFSELGAVRSKPSRGDAPPTLSKSCSDKLAMKQCLSLLSSMVSLVIDPRSAYLDDLIIPTSHLSLSAVERAFGRSGRFSSLPESLRDTSKIYSYSPFTIHATSVDLDFRSDPETASANMVGSNITAMWNLYGEEVLIGGTVQGHKQFSTKGASRICRVNTWKTTLELGQLLDNQSMIEATSKASYGEAKASVYFNERREVKSKVIKSVLQGWQPNIGDHAFAL